MPSLESIGRTKKAIWWEAVGKDAFGELTVSAAVELSVRWVRSYRQVTDAKGNTIGIAATVVANRALGIDSLLFLGTIATYDSTVEDEVMQVVTESITDDIRGRETRYEYGLNYFRGKLPVIV